MRLHFDAFVLDSGTRQLFHEGRERPLRSKVFDLLELLLKERPNVVSKRRIRQELWPATAVSDSTLATVANELRAALDEDPKRPRLLRTVHGVGYAFCGEASELPGERSQYMADFKVELEEVRGDSTPEEAARPARRGWVLRIVVPFASMIGACAGYWLFRRAPPPLPRMVELTATQGTEWWPTLSPDGNQVAFSWEGDAPADRKRLNRDIWLKIIGASETRRLTTDPAFDGFPSWSPDGRSIAFLRGWSEGGVLGPRGHEPFATIWLVSPLGGVERKVGDFRADAAPLAWSPDGRFLAARRFRAEGETAPAAGGIHLVSLQDGQARAITAPIPPAYHTDPAFAPDGRRLAFASCANRYSAAPCEVNVVDVDADFLPRAAPRRLTSEAARATLSGSIGGIAWSRDGGSVIYTGSIYDQNDARLWRVSARGELPAERVEIAGHGAQHPATTPGYDRLAFTLRRSSDDIYRFDPDGPPKAVVASTFQDAGASFSPDGRRIAFESGRSGQGEIWLADADGSNPIQLTRGPGVAQVSPSFSPDGRRVAFTSIAERGFADIWVIDVAGGSLRRLTDGPFHEGLPSWSRDGRFIYYGEARADGRDIFRIPAAGGTPERMTHHGALRPRESPDGRTLFYARRYGTAGTSPLMSLMLPDGRERQVVDCIFAWSLETGPDGIYYTGCPQDRGEIPFYRLDTISGRSRLLGSVPARGFGAVFLAVSPDGKTILFTKQMAPEADLMLIESFR